MTVNAVEIGKTGFPLGGKFLGSPRLWVTTYGKYNDGRLIGEWMDLDDYADRDEFLAAAVKMVNEHDPELMFCDYENFPWRWYSESEAPPAELWEWTDLDDDDKEIHAMLVEAGIEMGVVDAHVYRGELIDYAAELIDDGYNLDEFAARYFDYEAFARDMKIGGDVVELTDTNDVRADAVWLLNPHE